MKMKILDFMFLGSSLCVCVCVCVCVCDVEDVPPNGGSGRGLGHQFQD